MPISEEFLNKIEQEVADVYKTADKEIREKWDAYMKMMAKKVDSLYAAYEQAVKDGEQKLADDLLYEYQRNVQNMTLQDSRYRSMIRETTEQLAHTNETALNVVNGKMGQVYTLAYNELAQDIQGAHLGGYSFTLVDQRAVDYLIANGGSLLPDPSGKTLKEILQKSLDLGKDMRWNSKKLNSQVLQSILQGESIGKMADRLQNVTDMNRASAIRNARTMNTNARNKGKQDSILQAEADGVILKRVWKSQHDERVRVEHESADGQERGTNEPFNIGGYPLMYPGDRTGPARLVYNCRCRLGTRIIGFMNESGNGYTAVDSVQTGAHDTGIGKNVYYDDGADYSVKIDKYSDKVNEALSRSARKVAMHGSETGYEYASLIDVVTGEEVYFGTSSEPSNVNSYFGFLRSHLDGHYSLVHNHNTADMLSLPDIGEIVSWENLDSITAVSNNGLISTAVSYSKSKDYIWSHYEKEISEMRKAGMWNTEIEKEIVRRSLEEFCGGGMIIHDGRKP